jgi:transcriptional regulator with XRE-family HTH domain
MAHMSLMSIVDSQMSDDAAVGLRVDLLMRVRRVATQTALAERMGVSQSVLSKKIRGHVSWSVSDLRNAAYELGTTVSYLVGETDEPRPGPDAVVSPLSDSNRRPPLYIVGGSDDPASIEAECDWPGGWPDEDPKHKDAA